MYCISEFTKPVYKTGEAAKIPGITTWTLRVYENDGRISYFRSEGGHRLVKREDLLLFLQQKGILLDDTKQQKRDVIYARVSSHEQKARGDLDRQAMHSIESQEKDVRQELAEDMMSLIAGFSGKLYGMRSHKNKEGLHGKDSNSSDETGITV